MRSGIKINKRKRKGSGPLRSPGYDYSAQAFYFVTICTKNRERFFGHITEYPPTMHLTEIGHVAQQYWSEIPSHFTFVELYDFVIMPDHVHDLLFFNTKPYRLPQVKCVRAPVPNSRIGNQGIQGGNKKICYHE